MKFRYAGSNQELLSYDFNLCLMRVYSTKGQNAAFLFECVVETHDTHTKANSFGASSTVNEGCELSLTCKNLMPV